MAPRTSATINPVVLRDAAGWFARLNRDTPDQQAESEWRDWLAISPEHQQAWARVEAIDNRIRALDKAPGKATLSDAARSRRRLLKNLVFAGIGLPFAASTGWKFSAPLRADYSTTVGELRQLTLADGSELWLNTASAVNVSFNKQVREFELLRGELSIRTGDDLRPLQVNTPLGKVQPLGTWFSVRVQQDEITIRVYDGRVALYPKQSQHQRILESGSRATMTGRTVSLPIPLSEIRPHWTQGMLVTDGMRLDEVIAELSRYCRGYLGVTDEVADLRLVGAFPLQNTDDVLRAIERILPVKVLRLTPWWVQIQAAK